jgi:LuxR family maltose regulon positive regulatory protein
MFGDLLKTKLHVPVLRPSLVRRSRLLENLNQGLSGKLTLVSAPAGFGKTTLIGEWLATSDLPAAWLSLDEEDSDPVRFLRYVIAGLQTIHPDLGEEVVRQFAGTSSPPSQAVVSSLINEIGEMLEDFVFVLDDYHLIRANPIHEALAFLIERQPPQLHLVITTREDPPLPLPRWRARGELTEIRERDRRFSGAETNKLLNDSMGLNLTPEQIDTLGKKTEGWVSGLQLAALSLRGQIDVDRFIESFAGSNRFILDYLIEEVFRQQPPEVREFLLHTAILEQLTAPLCDAVVMGEGGSQEMLERLERANLFTIPLDESRRWFRYHHLFADLLRQRLRVDKVDTAVLHMRAARWLEQHTFWRRAVYHYLTAAAWEEAALLIQVHNDELQKLGENSTFLRWMKALPDRVIQANPALCLDYAWALALNGEPDDAERFLKIAQEAFRDNPERFGAVLSAQIHIARIRHDLPQTIILSQRALSFMPDAAHDPRSALLLNLGIAYWQQSQIEEAEEALTAARQAAILAQNQHVRLLAIGFLGLVQAARGRLLEAASLLQSALSWGSEWPASGLPHLVLGALFYEWDRLEDARSHLQKAIDLAQYSGNSELASSAYRQWALLKQAEGDSAAALLALTEAKNAAGDNAPLLTHARNNAVAVTIGLAQNNLEMARERIGKMQTAASASLFYSTLFLAPARLSLAEGNQEEAAEHLAAEFEKAVRLGLRYGQIEIRLLQALAARDAEEGLVFLTDALTMAHTANFRRTFLDTGKVLLPLLHQAVSKQVYPEYTRELLALLVDSTPAPIASTTSEGQDARLVEAISEREVEVLKLLADGRTNQEIAEAMFVSVNTVKSHLKNIYGKLGVHNRREAVSQARLLNLL